MTRTRTILGSNSGVSKGYTYSATHLDGWNGTYCKTTTTNYTGTYIPYSDVKVMTDVVTPNFKKRMLNGEIINNPMSIDHTIAVDAMGSRSLLSYKTDTHGCRCDGWSQNYAEPTSKLFLTTPSSLAWQAPIPTIDVERLKDIALTNVFSKLGSSEASLYATIGELDETCSGIVQVLIGTVSFLKKVRQRKWYKLREYMKPKELASRWMEVRYGLRPLAFEMVQYMNALKALSKRGLNRLTFRSSQQESGSTSRTYEVIRGAKEWKFKGLATCHRDVSVRAGCLADIEVSIASILGLDRPLSGIYELVTLSFVLDWFFNIGKLIAALEPKAGVEVVGSWVIVDDIITHTFVPTSCTLIRTGYSGDGSISGRMYFYHRAFSRSPNPQKPILPHFDLKLNFFKSVDLGIILSQLGKAIFHTR